MGKIEAEKFGHRSAVGFQLVVVFRVKTGVGVFGFEIVNPRFDRLSIFQRDDHAVESSGFDFAADFHVISALAPEEELACGAGEHFERIRRGEKMAHGLGGGMVTGNFRRRTIEPFDRGEKTMHFGAEFPGFPVDDD